jgi:hypothetical protein
MDMRSISRDFKIYRCELWERASTCSSLNWRYFTHLRSVSISSSNDLLNSISLRSKCFLTFSSFDSSLKFFSMPFSHVVIIERRRLRTRPVIVLGFNIFFISGTTICLCGKTSSCPASTFKSIRVEARPEGLKPPHVISSKASFNELKTQFFFSKCRLSFHLLDSVSRPVFESNLRHFTMFHVVFFTIFIFNLKNGHLIVENWEVA